MANKAEIEITGSSRSHVVFNIDGSEIKGFGEGGVDGIFYLKSKTLTYVADNRSLTEREIKNLIAEVKISKWGKVIFFE